MPQHITSYLRTINRNDKEEHNPTILPKNLCPLGNALFAAAAITNPLVWPTMLYYLYNFHRINNEENTEEIARLYNQRHTLLTTCCAIMITYNLIINAVLSFAVAHYLFGIQKPNSTYISIASLITVAVLAFSIGKLLLQNQLIHITKNNLIELKTLRELILELNSLTNDNTNKLSTELDSVKTNIENYTKTMHPIIFLTTTLLQNTQLTEAEKKTLLNDRKIIIKSKTITSDIITPRLLSHLSSQILNNTDGIADDERQKAEESIRTALLNDKSKILESKTITPNLKNRLVHHLLFQSLLATHTTDNIKLAIKLEKDAIKNTLQHIINSTRAIQHTYYIDNDTDLENLITNEIHKHEQRILPKPKYKFLLTRIAIVSAVLYTLPIVTPVLVIIGVILKIYKNSKRTIDDIKQENYTQPIITDQPIITQPIEELSTQL